MRPPSPLTGKGPIDEERMGGPVGENWIFSEQCIAVTMLLEILILYTVVQYICTVPVCIVQYVLHRYVCRYYNLYITTIFIKIHLT